MPAETILVVDDEQNVLEVAGLYLRREGFTVETAGDGNEALAKVRQLRPSLVILDIMLPGLDGMTVCREIRKIADTPIVMLTARGEELDKILGLELGADDYVTKPFSPRELVARVKAVLRRAVRAPQAEATGAVTYPGLFIDSGSRVVKVDGETVDLTPREFDLLWFLAANASRVFTREQLLERVWGYDYFGDARTVDTHIKRLREKVEGRSAGKYIKTVWGVGYKFEVDR